MEDNTMSEKEKIAFMKETASDDLFLKADMYEELKEAEEELKKLNQKKDGNN